MRVISSRWTFFYKRIVPLIGWGLPALAILRWLTDGHSPPAADAVFLLIPIGTAVLSHCFLHALAGDLADEVVEAGDSLIVRKDGEEARIALADVVNVDASTLFNPPRITLSLRMPCRFGAKVVFSPPPNRRPFAPFAPNPTAEALIERVHRARMAR
jgi:hypothetical protein